MTWYSFSCILGFHFFFPGGGPPHPLEQVHMEKFNLFSNHTSAPRQNCFIMIQIIVIYLLSVYDWQILKTMILWYVVYLFVACDYD